MRWKEGRRREGGSKGLTEEGQREEGGGEEGTAWGEAGGVLGGLAHQTSASILTFRWAP